MAKYNILENFHSLKNILVPFKPIIFITNDNLSFFPYLYSNPYLVYNNPYLIYDNPYFYI